jgi:hypothetical protein
MSSHVCSEDEESENENERKTFAYISVVARESCENSVTFSHTAREE